MTPSKDDARRGTADPTRAFFEQLAARGHEPLLGTASGTLRFDLMDGGEEHWYVKVEKGDVNVSHRRAAADTVVRTSRTMFDQIVSGRANAMAAMLRGVIVPEGNPSLLLLFQRLFPGPPPSRPRAGRERRTS